MNQGTVNDYLGVYVSADRVKLLRDIATGMNHLHNNGVVHGDLKGANVLVDEDGIARIADFGLSSFTYEDKIETDTELTGSTRWMAPELFDPDEFHGKTVRTTYSDVYAFAMTAIEIFSSEKPFRNISKYAVIPRVLKGIRPDRPCVNPALGLSDSIWGLMKRCWHQDPGKRPAFAVILQSLGSEPGEFPGVG
ncbi:hypothetical protein CERSUDRAFT_94559 [Gelatoporia subvermispora B]|uniref:Protein kinase domain-containing protein n=1 Tax=Ceriporiopsis subvermispora (strain B) TaxID=914234 RepID=M2QKL0_CERS8|nr:hypothetical protein CERSUDRAFT_94559 [Gelatoporia subvermispora B]